MREQTSRVEGMWGIRCHGDDVAGGTVPSAFELEVAVERERDLNGVV
jgi:hypothetical protein